ncbi:MAG TPA: MFS transporter [Jiangellaceae bacterium]|nr:MFS transporter [Jiangellaceae bacterium]
MATSTLADQSTQPRDRLFTPAFVGLAVADLAYFTAAGLAILVLPLYVTGPVGSTTAGAGLAFGAFAVSALVLRPVAGRLTDTLGRRPLMMGGAVLAAACLLATAYTDSLAVIVGLRLLSGVAEAAFFVASYAALADLAPPSRMGEALSYNSLGLYLGIAFGPVLGDLLVRTWGYAAAWQGAAVLALLAAAVVLGIGETRKPRTAGDGPTRFVHWPAIPPALGFLASIVAMGGFLAFVALHADDVGMARTGLPLTLYGLVVVICRFVFARVPDRLPPLKLGAASLVAMASGLILIAMWPAPSGVITGAILLALGVTFSTPAFFTAVFATARPSERGAASGTASACIDIGLGGGPIMLGVVAAAGGIPVAFAVAAAVALVGCTWTIRLARRRPAVNRSGTNA